MARNQMKSGADARLVLIVAVVALVAALAAVGAAVLGMPPEQLAPRLWRGYYTVLAGPSAGLPPFAAALAGHPGIDAVVSRYTSPASFNTFDGFATLPVAGLAARLDPQDPRYDPYLRGLEAYFRNAQEGGSQEVMYIRSDRSPAWLLALFARLPEARGLRLRLLETGPAAALRLALFCAFGALLVARQRGLELRLLSAAAALPWLPVIYFGSALSLLASLALLPVWPALLASVHPFLRERVFAPSRRHQGPVGEGLPATSRPGVSRAAVRLLPPLLAVAALFLLLKRAGQPLGAAALAGASGLLLLPLLYAAVTLRLAFCQHVPFLPVPILARGQGRSRGRPGVQTAALLMICVAVLSLPLLALWSRLEPRIVPAPAAPTGADLSWASLEALSLDSQAGVLPDLADYVSHQAYQEGLAFGRPYTFPSLGERVVIPSFARGPDGQGVVRADRVVLRYPDAWLARTLDNAPEGSVARLLVDQAQAVPVHLRNAGVPALGAPALALCLCVALALGFLLLPAEFDLTALRLCANRGFALRRRQHAL
jgi:hypothetical protein